MIRALLIGYGKMGKLIAQLAPHYNIAISAICDHRCNFAEVDLPDACMRSNHLSQDLIDSCDVAFDFSAPNGILSRILQLATAKKPMIIGTTDWQASEAEAKKIIHQYNSALLTSPNFSLGVAIFFKLSEYAAHIFSEFNEYDVGMLEIHHRQKTDTPSGTAKEMARRALHFYPDKKVVTDTVESKELEPNQIHLSSLRAGHFAGTHKIFFDSPEDSIEISHTARNRNGFAKGALSSAYWLIDKKGWFTVDDIINEKLHSKTRKRYP